MIPDATQRFPKKKEGRKQRRSSRKMSRGIGRSIAHCRVCMVQDRKGNQIKGRLESEQKFEGQQRTNGRRQED